MDDACSASFLISNPINVRYLTGFESSNAFVLVDLERVRLLTDVRYIEAARGTEGVEAMLVERGLLVMNVEVVGDAYGIASNYLRRTGAIPDTSGTNERLLQIIVRLFERGEFNRIKLANKAIAKFEADELV